MLKYLMTLQVIVITCTFSIAQKPASPSVTVTGNGYTLTTPFLVFEQNSTEIQALAFGVRNENGKKTNVLLYEHKAFHYHAKLDDSTTTYLDLEIGTPRKQGGRSWRDMDFLRLTRSALQPTSNVANGYVIAFDMPDSLIADMRGKELSQLTFGTEGTYNGYYSESRVEQRIQDKQPAHNIFITQAAKIPGGKSIFTPITPFLKNRIPLASLFHQPKSYIDSALSAPVKDTNRNGTIYVRHITQHGTYEIEYKDNIAIEINLVPVYKFYRNYNSMDENNTPFELVARKGEDFPVTTKDCQHTAAFPKRKRMSELEVTVGNKSRFVDKVRAREVW